MHAWYKILPNFQLHDKQAMPFSISYVYLKQLGNSRSNYSPFLRWAGEWVESVDAKHDGAGSGDAIIKIYCDKHKCD